MKDHLNPKPKWQKLGVSQQYVNRQIKKCEFLFHLDGKKVIARREKAYIAGKQTFYTKEDMAIILGVSQEVIDKVFKKKTSGVIQTPKGKVKIAKLKPGETPIPLQPKVRPTICVWNDKNEKQEFSSFAAAAKELKIDPKTIPNALKAGKDSFARKSDERKFTIEIPEKTTSPVKKQRVEEKVQAMDEKDAAEEKVQAKEEEEKPEIAQKKDAAEDKQEEFDEKDGEETKSEELVYLGMGLWEKKTEKEEEEEEDPFWDKVYEENCPGLGTGFDLAFNKNKKLLQLGGKVERFIDKEKEFRVVIADACFQRILEDFGLLKGSEFEDNFYLSAVCPPNCAEYYRKYAHVGMLPIYSRNGYIWRIKITPPEKKPIPTI